MKLCAPYFPPPGEPNYIRLVSLLAELADLATSCINAELIM